MSEHDNAARSPGQRGRGNREGFSMGRGRGGPEEGRGRGRRDGKGGGASFRVVTELVTLEKALTKADYAAQKAPLNEVLAAVRALHLKSIDELDFNTRGKLLTALVRVVRQPKPKVSAEGAAAGGEPNPPEAAPTEEASPASAAPDAGAAPAAPDASVEGAPPSTQEGDTAAAPAPGPVPGAEAGGGAAPATAAPSDPKLAAYHDAVFTVGLVWRALHDAERSEVAFGLAGRQPSEAELEGPPRAPARERERPASAQGAAGRDNRRDRSERRTGWGDRAGGPPRERHGSRERPAAYTPTGDWQADSKAYEGLGRTRDVGRLHEKNQSFAEAVRLFEGGGDVKSALRNAALGKLDEPFARLAAKLAPEQVAEVLERAQAFEKLMEYQVARQDFEAVARLYERARQFDQAAAAWERAGKFSPARKAFERARDFPSAARMRDLELSKLIERGDRLGAATLLMGVGKKAEAIELLKPLPAPKAFHFLQKLNLGGEAHALGQEELKKAEEAGNQLNAARWLELLGLREKAAERYLAADRKDKAAAVFASMGNHRKAAQLLEEAGLLDKAVEAYKRANDHDNATRVAALPRPEVVVPAEAPEEPTGAAEETSEPNADLSP